MLRKEFVEKYQKFIAQNYSSSTCDHDFDIYVEDAKDGKNRAQEVIIKFLNSLNIVQAEGIIKQLNKYDFHVEYDSYYEEDEDADDEFCRFNCRFNIHKIYDLYVLESNFDLKTKQIYRLDKDGKEGLYSGFFATLNVGDNHPSPQLDQDLKIIFHDDNRSKYYDYHRQWYFGFESLDDVKSWIGSQENLDKLIEKGYSIKSITVPENFVMVGDRQVIFQKAHVVYETELENFEHFDQKHSQPMKL